MLLASRCAIPLSEFWQMTPWQFWVVIEGVNKRLAEEYRNERWVLWHNVAMARSTNMPDFDDFMGIKKEKVQGIDEAAILAGLQKYAKPAGGNGE